LPFSDPQRHFYSDNARRISKYFLRNTTENRQGQELIEGRQYIRYHLLCSGWDSWDRSYVRPYLVIDDFFDPGNSATKHLSHLLRRAPFIKEKLPHAENVGLFIDLEVPVGALKNLFERLFCGKRMATSRALPVTTDVIRKIIAGLSDP
jgi:hypothetical protein